MVSTKKTWLYALICLAVFASGLSTGNDSWTNMRIIHYYELLIVFLCLLALPVNHKMLRFMKKYWLNFLLGAVLLFTVLVYYYFRIEVNLYLLLVLFVLLSRDLSPFWQRIQQNPGFTVLLILWAVSVSISFYFSPLGLTNNQNAIIRFEQTFLHLILFLVLTVFLDVSQVSPRPLLLTIPCAMLVVGFFFVVLYFFASEPIGPRDWFNNPPFNAHIRHIGYTVTAALVIGLAYLPVLRFRDDRTQVEIVSTVFLLSVTFLWAFLFWCGGRSSIGAIVVTSILIGGYLWYRNVDLKRYVILITLSALLGLFLSVCLSVFPWNGLYSNVERTVSASSVHALTSGRAGIWEIAFLALENNWLFGLGADAYVNIPGVRHGVVQPHSMFVQFLTEWGVLGSLLITILLLKAFLAGLGQIVHSRYILFNKLAAGSAIVALTIHGVMDGTYFHSQPVFILALLFAVWLAKVPVSDESESNFSRIVVEPLAR